MRKIFVDTSGFYALLDGTDPFHEASRRCFELAESDGFRLITTSYVVHESWALIQRRLGWVALDSFLQDLLPRCEIVHVDQALHIAGETRCRDVRERRFSLTDAVSLECMKQGGLSEAIAEDEHFRRDGVRLP